MLKYCSYIIVLLLASCGEKSQYPSHATHKSYGVGQEQALLDISSGNIQFKLFGESPIEGYYILEENLKKQYSANCVWVAGCIVEEGQPENCYGYNTIIMKHLLEKYPNVLESLSASANLSIGNILGQYAIDENAL